LIRNRLGFTTCDDAGNCYDTGSDVPGGYTPSGNGGGTNWAQFAGTLVTDATKLAQPFIQSQLPPPQYVQGAYGAQVLYNPQTGQVTQARQTLPSGLTAPAGGVFAGGSTWLPLLIIAGLAFVLVSQEGKH
jgi:hypothetical protein